MKIPSLQNLSVDYPKLYREMQELQDHNWWFKVHYPAILDIVIPYIKPEMKVLDLGSASGWSTAGLPPTISRIMFDIRPLALTLCNNKSLARICGDAHHIPLRDSCCDVIICEGLLHQYEAFSPSDIVKEAVRICSPGGVIISAEPAFKCLYGSHDVVEGGCRRFKVGELTDLFSGLPVTCNRKTYLHLFVFAPAWFIRRFRKRDRTDLSMGNRVTNRICVWLGTIERWIGKYLPLPFGITAVVLMQKNIEK